MLRRLAGSRDVKRARLIAAASLLFIAGCASRSDTAPAAPQIGLFTTLPILWQESDDLRAHLNPQVASHWALAVLRRNGEVRPLNSLGLGKADRPLSGVNLLVMAQPRPLSPQENVTLDNWVRSGGRVLLFADPMLTAESTFALGDRRRPQDVVLLSPILERWGLELTFDEEQAPGEVTAEWQGSALPVDMPGRFLLLRGAGQCVLIARGLGVRCRIGKGQVLALADAALLEDRQQSDRGQRPEMLGLLIGQALAFD